MLVNRIRVKTDGTASGKAFQTQVTPPISNYRVVVQDTRSRMNTWRLIHCLPLFYRLVLHPAPCMRHQDVGFVCTTPPSPLQGQEGYILTHSNVLTYSQLSWTTKVNNNL